MNGERCREAGTAHGTVHTETSEYLTDFNLQELQDKFPAERRLRRDLEAVGAGATNTAGLRKANDEA